MSTKGSSSNYTDEITLAEFKTAVSKIRLTKSLDTSTWADTGARRTENYLKTLWETAVRGAVPPGDGPFKVIDEAVRMIKNEPRSARQFVDVEWVLHREGKRIGVHVQVAGIANADTKDVLWTELRVLGVVPEDRILSKLPPVSQDMSHAGLGKDAAREIYCTRMKKIKQEYGISVPPNPDFDCES
jgi:hypothetical protein